MRHWGSTWTIPPATERIFSMQLHYARWLLFTTGSIFSTDWLVVRDRSCRRFRRCFWGTWFRNGEREKNVVLIGAITQIGRIIPICDLKAKTRETRCFLGKEVSKKENELLCAGCNSILSKGTQVVWLVRWFTANIKEQNNTRHGWNDLIGILKLLTHFRNVLLNGGTPMSKWLSCHCNPFPIILVEPQNSLLKLQVHLFNYQQVKNIQYFQIYIYHPQPTKECMKNQSRIGTNITPQQTNR